MTSLPIITVYSKPDCQQCEATKKFLTTRGLAFEVLDITADIEPHYPGATLAAVKALGYSSAPVVFASLDGVPGNEVHWGGFNPIRLAELVKAVA